MKVFAKIVNGFLLVNSQVLYIMAVPKYVLKLTEIELMVSLFKCN